MTHALSRKAMFRVHGKCGIYHHLRNTKKPLHVYSVCWYQWFFCFKIRRYGNDVPGIITYVYVYFDIKHDNINTFPVYFDIKHDNIDTFPVFFDIKHDNIDTFSVYFDIKQDNIDTFPVFSDI